MEPMCIGPTTEMAWRRQCLEAWVERPTRVHRSGVGSDRAVQVRVRVWLVPMLEAVGWALVTVAVEWDKVGLGQCCPWRRAVDMEPLLLLDTQHSNSKWERVVREEVRLARRCQWGETLKETPLLLVDSKTKMRRQCRS